MSNRVFAEWAEAYRAAGYWPRPVSPSSKACHAPDWQKPDPELAPTTLAAWLVLTFKEAAVELNLPYFKIQRAAKRGDIPTYRLLNSRPLVRLSEVTVIEASKTGGRK
jgi:hypothetical protein